MCTEDTCWSVDVCDVHEKNITGPYICDREYQNRKSSTVLLNQSRAQYGLEIGHNELFD